MAPIVTSECDDVSDCQVTNQDVIQHQTKTCPPASVRSEPGVKFRGWRKWCLFSLLIFLILMVVMNLSLTLWILTVMRLNKDGMGLLKITPDGLQLSGDAFFLNSLVTSTIKTKRGEPLLIDSSKNFTIRTMDESGSVQNSLFVDNDVMECKANNFIIRDQQHNLLFSVNSEEVTIGADSFKITGDGGAVFDSAISTPLIRAESGDDLTLESPTRMLTLSAPQKIHMQTKEMDASSSRDFLLKSTAGSIVLDAPKIEIKNLQRAVPLYGVGWNKATKKASHVFQLCACSNGRLFLANSDGKCETHNADYICS